MTSVYFALLQKRGARWTTIVARRYGLASSRSIPRPEGPGYGVIRRRALEVWNAMERYVAELSLKIARCGDGQGKLYDSLDPSSSLVSIRLSAVMQKAEL